MDSPDILRERYRSLETRYFELRKEAKYPQAQETLDEMLSLVSGSSDVFDEAEDRIRILRARKLTVEREQVRLLGSRAEQARLLREAASQSTPSVCRDQPCAEFDPRLCVLRRPKLSTRQGRMCIEKITLVCEALKLEASVAAKRPDDPDLRALLTKRREAAEYHRFVLALDPSKQRSANQRYLEYWQAVTEGEASLLEGHFEPAKEWFHKALELGKKLHPVKCFPNFFRDVMELQAHDFFIDAVSRVREGQFRKACNLFQTWLNLFDGHASSNDPRYDSIKIYELACDILDRLPIGTVQPSDWDRISDFIEEANPSLPAWALVKRLGELRALQERSLPSALGLIPLLSQDWSLFVPDSQLLGKDKTAGLGRRVNHPSFLNIFDRLDKHTHDWKALLTQNLKNLLLIMADYESKRYANPPDEENALPKLARPSTPSEAMTIDRIAQITIQYLRRRSEKHASTFEVALLQLADFEIAISTDDFRQAVAIQKRIFENVRFWPHTIQILEQVELPNYSFAGDTKCFSQEKLSLGGSGTENLGQLGSREYKI